MAGALVFTPNQNNAPIPTLRQDLNLFPAEPYDDGAPAWVLHDVLSNRFFRLGEKEMDLLAFVDQGDVDSILKEAVKHLDYHIEAADITELLDFLRRNNLVCGDAVQQSWYQRQNKMMQSSAFSFIARSYLFFRIPLWHPDKFLKRTLPYVSWLGSAASLKCLIAMSLAGLLLMVRQFDSYMATFLHFFNLSGLFVYFIALFGLKILHELGHAYVAKAMGCRVPVIGVAFLVGWPVMFTDTSDAWKLASRRKRMTITAAGIGVEIAVAGVSLLCWSLAPEGIIRSTLFFLTTVWSFSLLINCNPFMKFDGYYLFSDWTRMPNLEPRATALAKWWLREKLFAFGFTPPERARTWVVCFAFGLWIYRFFLFLGIAVLVYYFFFKLAGIILFTVEIAYFIIRPVWNEINEWRKLKERMKWNRASMRLAFLVIIAIILVFLPWKRNISAPAVYQNRYSAIYTPVSGQISQIFVSNDQHVQKGDLLMDMKAPELEHEIEQAMHRHANLLWQRSSLGFDPRMLNHAIVIATELRTQKQRLLGLQQRHKRLRVTAPHDGIIADLNSNIRKGDWLGEGEPVLLLRNQNDTYVMAYLAEKYVSRIAVGQEGKFYPERGNWPPVTVKITEIDPMGINRLDTLYPASLYGGELAVRSNKTGELVPVSGTYRVRLSVSDTFHVQERIIRGEIAIEGAAESLLAGVWRPFVFMLRREGGF